MTMRKLFFRTSSKTSSFKASSSSQPVTGKSNRRFLQDDATIYYLRNSYTQEYLYVLGPSLELAAPMVEETKPVDDRGRAAEPANSSSLALSAEKVEDAFHQWRFIKSGNTFNLQNVGSNQYFNVGRLNSGLYKGYYTVSMTAATHGLKISGGSVIKMGINGGTTYCISDFGGTIYAVNASYWPGQGQGGRDEWHLEAVYNFPLVHRNPLPKGTYRIRSFHGSYLLTMPQVVQGELGNPYVTQHDQNDGFQKWSLVSEGNSLYTIRNSRTGQYLAGSSTKLVKRARLIGQSVVNGETPFQWKIDTFGPGVMFFIGLDGEPLSIGFPNYIAEDLSEVTLQPSDNIPSQIWFFEIFEPLSATSYHATEQLAAGTYILESCHGQQYLCVSTDDFVVSTSDHTKATNFSLEFVANNSANFTLSYPDVNYGTYYLSVEKNRLLTSDEDEKSTWVLLAREYKDIGTVYMICDSTSTDPRRVISCRRVGDRKRSYFALDALTEGDSMQFWKFRSVQTRSSTILDGA